MAKGVKDGCCSPWLWSSKHTLKQGPGGSRGRRGSSICVTSCSHKGLTHPAQIPALKVSMGLLHTAPRCSKPVVSGLQLCYWKVPV